MGKVVTSQGLQEFVQSGKVTHVPDHKPEANQTEKTALTPKVSATVTDTKSQAATEKQPEKAEESTKQTGQVAISDDDGLEPDERAFSEQIRAKIGKKHRAMKEAQENAAEAERFAEQQFNERKLAEKRAQELEAENADLKSKQAPAKPVEPELVEPNEADPKYQVEGKFDWKSYSRDLARYEAKKALADEKKVREDERTAAIQQEAEARGKASADRARKAHSDFDDVMDSLKGTAADLVPKFVLNYMSESENAGEIAYHLAKHPEERERISKLSPIRGLAEMGKLEDKLMKPPETVPPPARPVERGGPPAPITPLNGEGSVGIVTDPAKMDFKQLRAYERERARKKH